MSKELQIRTLSSLAKVFPKKIVGGALKQSRVACGQEVSFQIAYRASMDKNRSYRQVPCAVEIKSPLKDKLKIFDVVNVPSILPVYPSTGAADPDYISTEPGLFPDPLIPWKGNEIKAAVGIWRALWFSVKIAEDCPAGVYPVEVIFTNQRDGVVSKAVYRITVEPYTLPAQKLIYTQWFHCDCIADIHRVPVLSEAHWSLIEKYMRLAAEHGMNMILTPVVTPPLDTAVGGERPTVQLVNVEKKGDSYILDCAPLARYIRMALGAGISYFEISHFFTQWGAKSAPKVVAKVNGRTKKIFGWETDATSDEYANFLRQLVPAVIACFEGEGVSRDHLYFHVSDEPHKDQLEQYSKAEAILHPLIEGCHHMDALSDYDFYREGVVERPVVATDHIAAYLEAKVDNLWCYYCCGQGNRVSNRFLALPSVRNRIIGVQMYKNNIAGFLQWGYNFYYTQLSVRMVDPYHETDAGAAFPSGDAFTVYPYEDGATPSLRQKVFGNALEDLRLLKLLEEKIGRDRTVELLERVAGEEVTFFTCKGEEFFTALYDAIFAELSK